MRKKIQPKMVDGQAVCSLGCPSLDGGEEYCAHIGRWCPTYSPTCWPYYHERSAELELTVAGAVERIAELERDRDELLHVWGNLLAVINRDGGDRRAEFGVNHAAAGRDAEERVARVRNERDEALVEAERLREGRECHAARPGEVTYHCDAEAPCPACRLRIAETALAAAEAKIERLKETNCIPYNCIWVIRCETQRQIITELNATLAAPNTEEEPG